MDSTFSVIASVDDLVHELKPVMKALVICVSHSWGGLEQVAANDSVDLAKLGLSCRVLCIEGSPIHQNLMNRGQFEFVTVSSSPRNYFDFHMRSLLLRQLEGGVNLIHTHQTSLLGTIVPWIWNKQEVALFASRHIMNSHDKRDFFHQLIYSRVDKLIVMSQALRRNVMATHAVRERQVKVVSLGLDFEAFDAIADLDRNPQRERWRADDETLVIGLVGRIDPAKGQATFIRAAAGLSKSLKSEEKLKFVIVGEETLGSEANHLKELQEMVRQFGLDDRVIFTGFQKNIPEVMKALDVFVMPSRQETFGLVAIEAMAMETAIIISKGGSSTEIVGNNEFGLTVRPEDAFDLQRQIRYLLDHPEERVLMAKRAREHVVKNYDRKVRVQKTLTLYERALRARGIL